MGNRASYLAAFEGANYHLENIYSEYHELQRRKEQLEGVLSALQPFMQSAANYDQEFHAPEPVGQEADPAYSEPTYVEQQYSAPESVAEPAMHVERFAEPAPASVYAAAETNLDPLQLRINRALGLAVA